jgi:tRNA A37 threonylcarbamoyltransferase TsaD
LRAIFGVRHKFSEKQKPAGFEACGGFSKIIKTRKFLRFAHFGKACDAPAGEFFGRIVAEFFHQANN